MLDTPDKPIQKKRTKPRIDIDLAEVERLAGQGLNQIEIAHNLGIHESTLQHRIAENPEFPAAIARGRSKGIALATGVLHEILQCTDTRAKLDAAKFFLARRAQWSETVQNEVSGPNGGALEISITISKDDEKL